MGPGKKFMKGPNFLILLVTSMLVACASDEEYINDPQAGDIYLFEASDMYFPVRVDFVEEEYVYCNNSLYVFENDMPEWEDMPANEFDYSYHHIYEKAELLSLYKDHRIVRVLRR